MKVNGADRSGVVAQLEDHPAYRGVQHTPKGYAFVVELDGVEEYFSSDSSEQAAREALARLTGAALVEEPAEVEPPAAPVAPVGGQMFGPAFGTHSQWLHDHEKGQLVEIPPTPPTDFPDEGT